MPVDGKGGKGAEQPGPRSPVQREHGAGQPRAAFHVEDLQRLADLPVRHLLVLEPLRLGPSDILSGPPATKLDVVFLAQPVRSVVRRDVREIEEAGTHSLLCRVGIRRSCALLLPDSQALGPQLLCPGLVARLFGLPDLS